MGNFPTWMTDPKAREKRRRADERWAFLRALFWAIVAFAAIYGATR